MNRVYAEFIWHWLQYAWQSTFFRSLNWMNKMKKRGKQRCKYMCARIQWKYGSLVANVQFFFYFQHEAMCKRPLTLDISGWDLFVRDRIWIFIVWVMLWLKCITLKTQLEFMVIWLKRPAAFGKTFDNLIG